MTSDIEAVRQSLAPAAYRLLGEDGTIFLQPSWEVLGAAAADLPFDEAHPRAHRSWLGQQCGDWTAVRAAVEAEPNWEARPALHYRLGLARHHLGEPEVAIRLWLPLCWMDPVLFERHAPTIPSTILREEWNAFEGEVSLDEFADTTHAAGWFPAWLLLRHQGLVHLFQADEVLAAGIAARVFRHLLLLLRLESQGLSDLLVRERRALQQLSPGFFRYYDGRCWTTAAPALTRSRCTSRLIGRRRRSRLVEFGRFCMLEPLPDTRSTRLFLMINAANRDPRRFDDPDRLDVAREPNRHLAFSASIHFCVGAPLARLEAQIVVPALLAALSDLALGSAQLDWHNSLVFRGDAGDLPVATWH